MHAKKFLFEEETTVSSTIPGKLQALATKMKDGKWLLSYTFDGSKKYRESFGDKNDLINFMLILISENS